MIPIRDSIRASRYPVVLVLVIGANLLMFVKQLGLGPELETFVMKHALVPAFFVHAINHGAFASAGWMILLSMFMHGGWFHLLSNMWFLWIFGDNVEDRMGHSRFLVFYVVCGVLASLLQVLVNPSSRVPTVGASGAIAGVLAAYMVFFPTARVYTLVLFLFFFDVIAIPAVFFLGLWFVLQLANGIGDFQMMSTQTGGIAWFAHIGGFVAGIILGPMLGYRRKTKKLPERYPDQELPW